MVVSRARVADGVLAAACVVAGVWRDLQSGLFDGSPLVDARAPLAVTAALGVATGVAVFDRRRRPLWLYAGAAAGWLVAGAWPAIPIGQYAVGEYVRSARLRVALTAGMVAAVSTPMWLVYGADASLPISLALCILPVLAGLYLASRRALVASLEERARRNEREERLRIDQARAEERAQIARDMHDVVTHRVSLMVLHATALQSAEGKGAAAIAGQIQAVGRAALEELRTLVGVLRDGGVAPLRPQPGIPDLPELVAESQALGLSVELSIEDGLRAPSLVEHAVYRVVQEALTNAYKHAPAARAVVSSLATATGYTSRSATAQARRSPGRPRAVGFLLKDATADQMAQAVRSAAAGDAMLAPRVTRRLLHRFAEPSSPHRRDALRRIEVLTDKEREVLAAVGEGLPNSDIGKRLHLSDATVKSHVSRVLAKLQLTNRVQAAILAHHAGLVS